MRLMGGSPAYPGENDPLDDDEDDLDVDPWEDEYGPIHPQDELDRADRAARVGEEPGL
jgi:hypothetical protein